MQHFHCSYTAQQSCDGDLMCYGRMRLFVHKPLIASPGRIPALQDLGHGVGVVSGVTMRNSRLFLCTTTQTAHPDFAARTSQGCICKKKRWLLSGEVNEGKRVSDWVRSCTEVNLGWAFGEWALQNRCRPGIVIVVVVVVIVVVYFWPGSDLHGSSCHCFVCACVFVWMGEWEATVALRGRKVLYKRCLFTSSLMSAIYLQNKCCLQNMLQTNKKKNTLVSCKHAKNSAKESDEDLHRG